MCRASNIATMKTQLPILGNIVVLLAFLLRKARLVILDVIFSIYFYFTKSFRNLIATEYLRKFVLLQPLRCCAECAVHHERNVHEEQHYIQYMWREQAIIE